MGGIQKRRAFLPPPPLFASATQAIVLQLFLNLVFVLSLNGHLPLS